MITVTVGVFWAWLGSEAAGFGHACQMDARTLPAWVDPQAMAALILSLVNGVVIAAAVDPDGPDHRAVAAQFLSLLLAAGGLPGAADSGDSK